MRDEFRREQPPAVPCSAHSSTSHNTQMADTDNAVQMDKILAPNLCSNQLAIIVQEATNPPMTDRHDDYLPESREDDIFLDKNKRLNQTRSEGWK